MTVRSAKPRAINPVLFHKFKFQWKRFPQPTENLACRLSTRWVLRLHKNYQKKNNKQQLYFNSCHHSLQGLNERCYSLYLSNGCRFCSSCVLCQFNSDEKFCLVISVIPSTISAVFHLYLRASYTVCQGLWKLFESGVGVPCSTECLGQYITPLGEIDRYLLKYIQDTQ